MPLLPLKKNAPAIPPNTAAAIADAPNTPSASMYGVPEPAPGLLAAYSTLRFASSIVCSSDFFGYDIRV